MLIGILIILFGASYMDFFYIDKIEQGVKKYVVDKDRKKEILVTLKPYTKAVKEFKKILEFTDN